MINFKFQTTTGVYLGEREVYVAQFKGTLFGPQLVKFDQAQIQAPGESGELSRQRLQALLQNIKKLVWENKLNIKNVIIGLPGKEVLIRYFQMPRIPKSEWETAIKFEAKKYIPFKIEELICDFHTTLPKGKKEPRMDVIFVAVKREIAQRYFNLLDEAGLKPTVLEPAPFSLIRLFMAGKQLAKDKATAVVDIDYGMANINVVKDNISYITRDISLPVEEEIVFDNMCNEIRMSLDYYEKLFPAQIINKILLSGEVELGDWDKRLAEELKLPVEKVNFTKAIRVKKELPPLTMAVVFGLALRGLTGGMPEVNLYKLSELKAKEGLPKEVAKIIPEIRRLTWRAIAISCVALLAFQLIMFQGIVQKRKQLAEIISLRPKINLALSPSASSVELEKKKKELEKRLSSLDLIIDKRVIWTNKFNEIPPLIPAGVWLTDLSLTDQVSEQNKVQRSLSIRGVAYHEDPVQEVAIITKFFTGLKESDRFSSGFKEIKLEPMVSAEIKGQAVKNFVITCVTQ